MANVQSGGSSFATAGMVAKKLGQAFSRKELQRLKAL
jgi:hypothetical protein